MVARVADDIDYSVPGPLTDLAAVSRVPLKGIPDEPVDICRPAHSLVIHPNDAESLGLPDDRFAENQIRPAAALIEALLALDSAPLDVPRSPGRRVIGTCRHPLSQSFMRAMSSEFLRNLSPEGALRRAAHLAL